MKTHQIHSQVLEEGGETLLEPQEAPPFELVYDRFCKYPQ